MIRACFAVSACGQLVMVTKSEKFKQFISVVEQHSRSDATFMKETEVLLHLQELCEHIYTEISFMMRSDQVS